jgi:RNA polymerase sigma factor (sigma-70 family)
MLVTGREPRPALPHDEEAQMYDDPAVVALVAAARDGDRDAWDQIVERYAPLVWSICRRLRLSRADADDVGQNLWLKLFEHLGDIRDPAALPGWLARTTQNECLRVFRAASHQASGVLDFDVAVDGGYDLIDQELERARYHLALRDALAQLRPRCRELLTMLFDESRPSYREIGSRLDMKIGSIGPTRERCLAELRRCPPLAALIEAERRAEHGGEVRAQPVVD